MAKQHKRQRDIKTKLMAAVAMLLVSSIMMVSSTYAWFTLSTAPEVTGINTAVGANGNLEMALLPKDGQLSSITSAAGDGVLDIEERNVTWGNLVDVSDTGIYGLDKITLYPAALNATGTDDAGNPIAIAEALLKTPSYGADGRVTQLMANTFTGYYGNVTPGTFSPDDLFGVRAVGTASGMTDRQLSYRNARSDANTAKAKAATLAAESLNNNGSALANIAITHGMGSDDGKYTSDNVAALRAIIDDLQKEDGVLDQIETAYLQYILAYAASSKTGTEDTVWIAVKALVEAENATLESVQAGLTQAGLTSLPDALNTAITEYNETVAAVAEANDKLEVLEEALENDPNTKFNWSQISSAMTPLANPNAMKVNGFEVSQVKQNLGALVSSVTAQGGLVVTMATGGGVYADIADQSGDYTASIVIEKVEYSGITLDNMEARMNTASTVNPSYLSLIGAAVETAGAPAGAADGTLPISDMFGFVIDLAFRTNAAESNLLLQVDAADRIYGDNTNEQTMGHGATMTFKSASQDFSDNQVIALMGAIRIVFFDPTDDNKIIATAKLDAANATKGEDGLTAKIYLYKMTGGEVSYTQKDYVAGSTEEYYTRAETYTEATDTTDTGKTYYTKNADGTTYTPAADTSDTSLTYYVMSYKYTKVDATTAAGATAGTLYVADKAATAETKITDNVIMPLTQNTATALSVLVYLDGESVGNDDVATAATSMTGTMNLQFASSAILDAMDYADLHIPADNGDAQNP